jgi:hypothetical protein
LDGKKINKIRKGTAICTKSKKWAVQIESDDVVEFVLGMVSKKNYNKNGNNFRISGHWYFVFDNIS